MEIDLIDKEPHHKEHFLDKDLELADKFARSAKDRYKEMIASVLLVKGASADETNKAVLIVDDYNTPLLVQTINEMKMALTEENFKQKLDLEFSIMLASDFWKHFNEQNREVWDMMRRSYIVQDIGFMSPLLDLFVKGRIRPTKEARNVYFMKAEKSLKNSNSHLRTAIIDIYWSIIDVAHAAVMMAGITPPSPKDLAETFRRELVARNLLHKRCADVIDNIYNIAKDILHKKRWDVTGKEFDLLVADAEFFIKEVTEFIKHFHKKEDMKK